jgi:hypothetical protein
MFRHMPCARTILCNINEISCGEIVRQSSRPTRTHAGNGITMISNAKD